MTTKVCRVIGTGVPGIGMLPAALAAHSSTANITDLSTEPIRLRDNVVKRAEIKANVLRMKQPF